MKSRFRAVLAVPLAVVAIGVLASASAQAAAPEWRQSGKALSHNVAFTSTAGAVRLYAGEILIECKSQSSKGELVAPNREQAITLIFVGCETRNNKGEECFLHSAGAKSGEVVSNHLVGRLGKVAATQAASEVGLLLEEENGKSTIAKLEGICLEQIRPLTGRVVGEVTPTHVEQATSSLVFACAGSKCPSKQKINQIEVEGTTIKSQMSFFEREAYLSLTEAITFSEAVEVT
jgi:hypothetical protein